MEVLETDNDRFSTLVQAINFAGIEDTLRKGELIVFATRPTSTTL